ncbi:putative 2-C-methyl-D-erythritol 4-phosphate cytidylyltransferase [Prochlorococcus marinus str. MIT 9515]|uniref:2-C-methyl-D-erythritol 4-phosphate cytidylyltransferase n=1 Tax=Prochlorococcus marinus (strain MIT 9515) TaxID=167542 RepID=ISPD_PROM5|nr:2-C-methyl-D-erythritol 4-phosphate cytidylyltransferase [Prochlorococcus marinus]A2BVB5.1 RecName: Full=2-C-methyl-D-erythritol 4-phosphate cytidylyltransferase; AltName: Full=4-diphosphocytidyl-2C-methyl-D-erythritol synthase; AltName: Full=MEP cytidylyltransferase; Short=MCT [Prochlorococcus marinus str. MIT 9515]ABM71726.1 putative 2-C-methyl-D-erythritol 4-phosphate cytidylyltransferase [Prochlorococcus marinus str. MIT 9515]
MHVLIPAAGSGRRMEAGKNKLLIDLEGESLIYWTLKSVFSASLVSWVGIIGQPNDKKKLLNSVKKFSNEIEWINGGNTRQESVFNGLNSLPSNAEKVLIHDGARCLINPDLINKCALELEENDAVILATKVTDTIKIVDNEGYIQQTPNRQNLWAAQTPQGFLVKKLREAHEMAIEKNWKVTDDASLFEMLNWQVRIIEGNSSNIKITSPLDLQIAKLFLKDY